MEEIERIIKAFPERFTEKEKRQIKAAVSGRSSGYEIRQCDVCCNYMNRGYCFDDGSFYCSEECMEKDGLDIIDMKKYTAYYYGLEAEKLSEEVMSLPMPELEAYCKEHRTQDSFGFYTEWDCPDDLIERLNQCRRELLADGVKLPDREKVLEGFFSYWQEEVLPLYEEDGAILESFEDALNNDSPYSNGKDYISWNDAITEATK